MTRHATAKLSNRIYRLRETLENIAYSGVPEKVSPKKYEKVYGETGGHEFSEPPPVCLYLHLVVDWGKMM